MSIPTQAGQITPDWINTILHPAAGCADARVTACTPTRIGADTGFASQVFRLALTWSESDPDLPATIIVKLAADADNNHPPERLASKYDREARFYRELAGQVGTRIPRCHATLWQPDPPRVALLLEDLADATFGDAEQGGTIAQFQAATDCLAALHAHWWNSPQLDQHDWLRPHGDLPAQFQKLPGRAAVFRERFGDILHPDLAALTDRLGPRHEAQLARLAGPPTTLLHVDAHLDNFAFVGEGAATEAILFDWQGTARGLGVVDLTIMLGALDEPQRRHESDLLARYHEALLRHGVSDYDRTAFESDYRLALLRLWIGHVNGLGSPQAAEWTGRQAALVRQGIQRISAAALRHGLERF